MLGRGVKRKRSPEEEEAGADGRALLAQGGSDNVALLAQGGSDSWALLAQGGSDNGALLAQGGSDSGALLAQGGSDNGALLAQGGSDSGALLAQGGSDSGALLGQGGSDNRALLGQGGSDNGALLAQGGSDSRALLVQGGSDSRALLVQGGSDSGALLVQGGSDGGALLAQGGSDAARLQQRQLVMSLCLDKLQRPAGVELGLRRSVLLINTLRQIHEDMQGDVREDQAGTACSPWGLDPSVPSVSPRSVCGSRSDTTPLGGVDNDTALTCPACAEGEQGGLSPPSPVHPSSPPGAPWPSTGSKPQTGGTPPGSYGDLAPDDDVFEDIDTSMYDPSDVPPAAWALGSYWPVGLSLWGDEELKTWSAGHAGTAPSRLTDFNDLDHIMEILVNS